VNIFLDANICLDLLDTTRPSSKKTVQWYMKHKDNLDDVFYYSGDFITTFFYILTEKKKYNPKDTLVAIEKLSEEINPLYIEHNDFILAKNQFFEDVFDDFEDLIILNSTKRLKCAQFITNDKNILALSNYHGMDLLSP
jgi:predicted nucleic-acid-binding protein